jgi:rhomboid protease GluP
MMSDPAAERSFAVDFNPYVAGSYNRDLAGRGRLVVRPDEPRFVFHGRPRGTTLIGKTEVAFPLGSADIINVVVHGNGIEFSTDLGKSGRKQAPFVFTCEHPEDAAAIAALLPAAQDARLQESDEFARRLRQLPDSGTGFQSATNLIVGANIAMFVYMGLRGAGWFEVASMAPYFDFGGNNGAATTDGEWWRLVTSMFVHYGIVHLALNLWALYQAGHLVERLFGRGLYTLVYFGSGIAGGLATICWNGDRLWSAGASGAVFGVYGALLGYLMREKGGIPHHVLKPLVKSTLFFAGFNLLYGLTNPRIDNAAHVGGFVAGLILGWCCALPLDLALRAQRRRSRVIAGVLVIAAFTAVGVASAPRFDYRVSDERAWQAALKARSERANVVAKQEPVAIAAYENDPQSPELLRWLTTESIPFYRQWDEEIARLPLTPGRRTAGERERFQRVLRFTVENHTRLAEAVRAGSPTALAEFRARSEAFTAESPARSTK